MVTPDRSAVSSPFHQGEQTAQVRAGAPVALQRWAQQAIRAFMPDQHRKFYQQLPFMVAAARDAAGQPWATVLVGSPGFAVSPEATRLVLNTSLVPGDALANALQVAEKIGLLGIELETRRRNRINGTLTEVAEQRLSLTVDQSFGNCPQFISKRVWQPIDPGSGPAVASRHSGLTEALQVWIENADTFFIASGYQGSSTDPGHEGMDVSHRGGPAGFVRVANSNRLIFPDYAGNNFFNTVGNLLTDSRIGLLFVDFEQGNLLQIAGLASIDWDSEQLRNHPGAKRLISVVINQVVLIRQALPIRWEKIA